VLKDVQPEDLIKYGLIPSLSVACPLWRRSKSLTSERSFRS